MTWLLAILLALLDLKLNAFLRGVCFIAGQTKITQRPADAVSIRKSSENRLASDRWESSAKILCQPRGGDVVSERQIRIRNQGRLITGAQIVRIHVHIARDVGMVSQIVISIVQVLAGDSRAFQSRI